MTGLELNGPTKTPAADTGIPVGANSIPVHVGPVYVVDKTVIEPEAPLHTAVPVLEVSMHVAPV